MLIFNKINLKIRKKLRMLFTNRTRSLILGEWWRYTLTISLLLFLILCIISVSLNIAFLRFLLWILSKNIDSMVVLLWKRMNLFNLNMMRKAQVFLLKISIDHHAIRKYHTKLWCLYLFYYSSIFFLKSVRKT